MSETPTYKPSSKILLKPSLQQFKINKDTLITEFLSYRKTTQSKKYSDIAIELSKLSLPIPSTDPMRSFQKNPSERTFNDIHTIKWYLNTSVHFKKFRNDFSIQQTLPNNNNNNQDISNLARLCIICATEMNYIATQPKEFLFKIGDEADTFYLILNGSVDLLKTGKVIKHMTGYQYFRYLIDLKLKKENYQDEILLLNKGVFPINIEDYPNLHYIVFLNFFKEIMMGMDEGKTALKYSIQQIASDCLIDLTKMPLLDLVALEETKDYLSAYHLIVDYLPKFCHRKLAQYTFLHNDYEIKEVVILEYYSFLTLHAGSFFGDSGIDTKQKRNATVQSVPMTEYAILYREAYSHTLGKERQIVIKREAHFLHKNFFFDQCPIKLFEWKYFNKFVSVTKLKGEVLCEEGNPCDFVYFIRKGDFELYSYKNIIEMHKTCKEINEKMKEMKEKIDMINESKAIAEGDNGKQTLIEGKTKPKNKIKEDKKEGDEEENGEDFYEKQYFAMENNLNDIKKILNKRYKKKVFLYRENDIIGIEAFYFGMNNLISAVVSSEEAKVYRIDLKNLNDVINSERSIKDGAYLIAMNKMNIFYERLFTINKTNLGINDSKESYYKKLNEMKNSKGKRKEYIDRNGDHYNEKRNQMKRSTSAVSRCDYIHKSYLKDFISKIDTANSSNNNAVVVKQKPKIECIFPEIKNSDCFNNKVMKHMNSVISSIPQQQYKHQYSIEDSKNIKYESKLLSVLMKDIQADKEKSRLIVNIFPNIGKGMINSKSLGDINSYSLKREKMNRREKINELLQEQEQEKLRLWAEVAEISTLGQYPLSITSRSTKKTIVFREDKEKLRIGDYNENMDRSELNQGIQMRNPMNCYNGMNNIIDDNYVFSKIKPKKMDNLFNKRTNESSRVKIDLERKLRLI